MRIIVAISVALAACRGTPAPPTRPLANAFASSELAPRGFDHSAWTRFDLGNSHRQLACAACHMLGTTAHSACESCHANRDPHGDRFEALGSPSPCGLCHAPKLGFDPKAATPTLPWKSNVFDHSKFSKWPLKLKHDRLTCRQCHRGSSPTSFERFKSGAACTDCHAHAKVHADDAHPNGRFSNAQCTQCHR